MAKSEQLQVRLTAAEKAKLKRLARSAGQDVSSYVLSRSLPGHRLRFRELVRAVAGGTDRRFALAELNELLESVTRAELADAIQEPTALPPQPYWSNYVAAMIEFAAHQKNVPTPQWLCDIEPLTTPHFATPLSSLRLHLLRASPVPFRRRNVFVDASVGDRA